MKKIIVLLVLILSFPAPADYKITWSTIDGGGGRSTGGSYTLVGTIAQPDTGVSSGGNYVLSSGFWPGNFGCIVNLTDLMFFAEQWLLLSDDYEPFWPADINEDQKVNIADFAELSYYWYDQCPPDWPVK